MLSLSKHNADVLKASEGPASKYADWTPCNIACDECGTELIACCFGFRRIGSTVIETDVYCVRCDKVFSKISLPVNYYLGELRV